MLQSPDASLYPARPISYADDLQFFASSLLGLQDTATLVSVRAMVFNLSVAVHKLRAFHYCGLSTPPEVQKALIIHSAGWTPHTAFIRTNGNFKSLGVEYPINQADSTSLHLMKNKLLLSIRALSVKKAKHRSVNLVMAMCLYARGHTWAFSPRGHSGIVKKSTHNLCCGTPKTCTSPYERVNLAFNDSPRWSSNVSGTASTATLPMGISGPNLLSKPSAPVDIPVRTTPPCRSLPHGASGPGTGCLLSSRTASKAILVQPSHSGPDFMLLLSSPTP